MKDLPFLQLPDDSDQSVVLAAGIEMTGIWSAELHAASLGASVEAEARRRAACQKAWSRLNAALCANPRPLEGFLVVADLGEPQRGRHDAAGRDPFVGFVVVGRRSCRREAKRACGRSAKTLLELLDTGVEFADFDRVGDSERLQALRQLLLGDNTIEFARRDEGVPVGSGSESKKTAGFRQGSKEKREASAGEEAKVQCLSSWSIGDDSWRRLVEAVQAASGRTGFVAHFRGFDRAPKHVKEAAEERVHECERIAQGQQVDAAGAAIWHGQLELGRKRVAHRLEILRGPVLAVRSFLVSEQNCSDAGVSTVATSLDLSGGEDERDGSPGGAGVDVSESTSVEVLASLDTPKFHHVFGPEEATAVLRLPMPPKEGHTPLPVETSRRAVPSGRSPAEGTVLGRTEGAEGGSAVRLSERDRFRHTYVVGQTGTGKSTLLARMALQDIQEGEGVTILDPHGTMVESVLGRIPEERVEDVILFDTTDVERPLPFNPLRIRESEPLKYRMVRDQVIDSFHRYVENTFDENTYGPIFESHMRGSLGLLLGTDPQSPPLVPNLTLLYGLYANKKFRRELMNRREGEDMMVDQFIKQAIQQEYDHSFQNVGTYVTSKFNRFVFDHSLRNITCQNEIIDFDTVVNDQKILLVHLGKGRFGDIPARLLASQIVDRIRSAVMKRSGSDPAHHLFADEFQLFADDGMGELLAEARKFGLSMTMAHQYTDQLPRKVLDAALGNVGTKIAFRVGAPDAKVLAPSYEPRFSTRDLVGLPNFQCYVAPTGELGTQPFSMATLPLPDAYGEQRAAAVRRYSRETYGRERESVESEIERTWEAFVDGDPFMVA